MMITPERFVRALCDSTRLRIAMLLRGGRELCVCEITAILDKAQPKISRHLAILRENEVLLSRREGLNIHYRIHPDLPAWADQALEALRCGCANSKPYADDLKGLPATAMRDASSGEIREQQ